MKTKIFRFFLLAALVLSPLPFGTRVAAQIGTTDSKGISPAGFLNPDGTLNLGAGFSGSLDLSGYSVQIDPQRGPVFAPAAVNDPAPAASLATPGNWANVGYGGGPLNNEVRAIAVSGSDVYVGGGFIDAGNNPSADYIARWDGYSWYALGSDGSGNGSLKRMVRTIVVDGPFVYVGGDFQDVNNNGTPLTAADYLAKWNGTNWSALGSNGAGDGSLTGGVFAIAVSDKNVYVGGEFTDVREGTFLYAADYVAKWDGGHWTALGSNGAGNGSLGGTVYALVLDALGNLYVGGAFTDVYNNTHELTDADYIAKWNGSDWSALGSNGADPADGSLNHPVYALGLDGDGNLYAGGTFFDVNNKGTVLVAADRVAEWDGEDWKALGDFKGQGVLNGAVDAILVSGSNVYVSGYFTDAAGLPAADYVAEWDRVGLSWSALGSNGIPGEGTFSTGTGNYITALGMQAGSLFAGGNFYDPTDAGELLLEGDFFAQWDGSDWSVPGKCNNGALIYGNNIQEVGAIAVIGTNVYVGGDFVNVSNHGVNLPAADFIAKWDGSNWSALGNGGAGDGSLNGYVISLAVSGTDLYVGGYFTNVTDGGTYLWAADHIARWDGTHWFALGSDGAGSGALNGDVNTIAISGSNVYVGGEFTDVSNNGTPLPNADYVAKWDGAHWSGLGSNGSGDGALNDSVSAIAISGTNVYVGGRFTDAANNPAADYIAKWDGVHWSALGSNGSSDGALDLYVHAIAVSGSDLYVGGEFQNAANIPEADMIARWGGSSWSALGSNGFSDGIFCTSCSEYVSSILVDGKDVYVGGNFSDVHNSGVLLTEGDYIVKWDGANWSPLGNNGADDGALNAPVYALALNGMDILVGGAFANVNNNGVVLPEADSLAAYGRDYSYIYLPLVIR